MLGRECRPAFHGRALNDCEFPGFAERREQHQFETVSAAFDARGYGHFLPPQLGAPGAPVGALDTGEQHQRSGSPGGTRDRTTSPPIVSAKRECSRVWPETFGIWRTKTTDLGVWRRNRTREKSGFPAHSRVSWGARPNAGMAGWGGRDRTSEWRNQNPLPYRLATPQQACRQARDHSRAVVLRQRRSIGGVEPFQQAIGRFLPRTRPGNPSLYIGGRLPPHPRPGGFQIWPVLVPGAAPPPGERRDAASGRAARCRLRES